jgi:putative oxidoreductase
MNIVLWVLQILLGLYFIMVGVLHFTLPDGLPAVMSWMYELSPTLHWVSGSVEILGGLGLILPGLFKIQTRLTWMAAYGLALVMIGAMVFHISRGEIQNIVTNLVLFAVVAFIGYGRQRKWPLTDRT